MSPAASPLSVNDPGYQALRSAAAWLDLSARGKIIASGEDRARLLHAMTTNQVQELKPGDGCYAFFLNPQGRILADVNLFCRENDFLLDVEPETRESLYQHLDHYIIADDVTLEDATDRLATLALEGPQAFAMAARIGTPVPEKPWAHLAWNDVTVANVSSTGAPALRFFVPVDQKQALIEKFAIPEASPQAARVVRLENFQPRFGEDILGTTLSQETQQSHAVNFNKGCYIGQEIVERVRSRGLVHRLLAGVEMDSTEPPEPDTRLFQGDQDVGKITSAAFSPALGKVVAMAYVRRELAEPGTALTVNGGAAVVRALHRP
ncbi:MAG TPA: glycine cleavage T C-terminal barrel domain-containing protein [Bryobacteraceae bacterium]|nr:glycine cleavage T C-terminal barrel domain-containing protein [Bryobacteraceae bacterium]